MKCTFILCPLLLLLALPGWTVAVSVDEDSEQSLDGDVELDSETELQTTTTIPITTNTNIRRGVAVNPICRLPPDSGSCSSARRAFRDGITSTSQIPALIPSPGSSSEQEVDLASGQKSQSQSQDQGQGQGQGQGPVPLPVLMGILSGSEEKERGNGTRFYYSTTNYKCAEFPYSGCGGNQNNFATLESCRQECDKTSTDVDEIKVAGDTAQCWYKNKLYKEGEAIGETTVDNACSVGCLCGVSGTKGEAPRITCAAIDCPPPPETKDKCVPIYKSKTCCPSSWSCLQEVKNKNQNQNQSHNEAIPGTGSKNESAVAVAEVFKCKYDGEEYLLGQNIYPKQFPCYTCPCSRNFTGVLNTDVCEEVNCGIAIHRQYELVHQCEPTYYKTDAGKESCCPIDWTCAQSNPEDVEEEEEEEEK